MRLFDWLIRKNSKTPWIEREKFVEEIDFEDNSENKTINNMDLTSNVNELPENNGSAIGRKEIDDYLNRDFGRQGYRDALINPDTSNADSNKSILKYQLEIIIERVLTFYQNKIKDYNFHIKTRTQNGMMDTVDEINSEKEKCLEEIQKIETILTEAKQNTGKGHVIILSYEQGFKRGLAAITASKLFGKNLNNE